MTQLSPAKLNLFLAITGQRSDGYHNLLSFMMPLPWGDRFSIKATTGPADSLVVTGPFASAVPTDASNLILKAIARFRKHQDVSYLSVRLEKNIPHGAGLGGGSSNAGCTLLWLNKLSGNPLCEETILEIASELGSDVPFFLKQRPQIMSGRGDKSESIAPDIEAALQGWHWGVMRPVFSMETVKAYCALRAQPEYYISEEMAAQKLDVCLNSLKTGRFLPFNSFEPVLFKKFPIYNLLRQALSVYPEMTFSLTGSGSACFVATKNCALLKEAQGITKKILGPNFFWIDVMAKNFT